MTAAASEELPPLHQINVSVVDTPVVEVSSPTLMVQSEAVQPQQPEQLHYQQLLPLQLQENQQGTEQVEVVVENLIATASTQLSSLQQICVSAVSATVASLPSSPKRKESSDPNNAVALQQKFDLVESIDAVVVAVEECLQPTTNNYYGNVDSIVDVDSNSTEELQLQQKDVRMCKSDVISFKFETSLLRDENKLTVMFKSLPEYANNTSDLIAEYQGRNIHPRLSSCLWTTYR